MIDILLVTAAIVSAAAYVYRRLHPRKTTACGGCDNCGATRPGIAEEVHVPLSNIGRRNR